LKTFQILAATAGLAALAACGGQGDDAAGEAVQEEYEAAADVVEEQADTAEAAGNEVLADQLEEKADAIEETGEAKEEAIDEADVKVEPDATTTQ